MFKVAVWLVCHQIACSSEFDLLYQHQAHIVVCGSQVGDERMCLLRQCHRDPGRLHAKF